MKVPKAPPKWMGDLFKIVEEKEGVAPKAPKTFTRLVVKVWPAFVAKHGTRASKPRAPKGGGAGKAQTSPAPAAGNVGEGDEGEECEEDGDEEEDEEGSEGEREKDGGKGGDKNKQPAADARTSSSSNTNNSTATTSAGTGTGTNGTGGAGTQAPAPAKRPPVVVDNNPPSVAAANRTAPRSPGQAPVKGPGVLSRSPQASTQTQTQAQAQGQKQNGAGGTAPSEPGNLAVSALEQEVGVSAVVSTKWAGVVESTAARVSNIKSRLDTLKVEDETLVAEAVALAKTTCEVVVLLDQMERGVGAATP